VLDAIDALQAAVDRVRALVNPPQEPAAFDPNDPRFKMANGTLTDEGAAKVYELFDAGKTRFAVKKAMNISFGAATYRFQKWQELGGKNRTKN
jgi:hypothetical protein